MSTPYVFGIRHHGPGSARSLRDALETLQPDVILVEGPPDADGMLPLLVHPEMQPPVALLIYVPDRPQRCVYYPFAVFSPEWQAIHYGLTHNIPVRFMDLPQAHQLVETPQESGDDKSQPTPELEVEPEGVIDNIQPIPDIQRDNLTENTANDIRLDPLGWLGKAAGYSDGERWWEHLVEQRQDSADLFAAILEAMTALRQEAPPESDITEVRREAYMRNTIRAAQKEGFQRIAVVCGAWHAPALVQMPPVKEDNALLKGLPKTKVEATWVPWTYGRLSFNSGYGAGVGSPGWYHHLWTSIHPQSPTPPAPLSKGGEDRNTSLGKGGEQGNTPLSEGEQGNTSLGEGREQRRGGSSDVAIRWMAKVAQLLRQEDLDASSANLIEAVRLAESLAALRDRPLPGLPELNEATQTVLCFGSDLPMRLIHDKLIVGDRLGEVPHETPMVPLQQDLLRQQKRLRMPAEATEKIYELDLRKENDLARSHLLHRLQLLGIPWGEPPLGKGGQRGGSKGTFKENWRVQWQPEFAVKLIEVGIWGNTILDAATAYACDTAQKASDLPVLTRLIDRVLLADLPDAINYLMTRLQAEAALHSDVAHLMEALPPLANVLRYGNVRKTDTSIVSHVVDGLVARICINLPGACSSLDDDAAAQMYQRLNQVNRAIALLQNEEHMASWRQVLTQLADKEGDLHNLLAGRSCRLLLDAGIFEAKEAARRMGLALSTASEPPQAAAWVEGFLKEKASALLLLHDDKLWQILDSWVTQLKDDTFTALLPLLRRTFSTFLAAERRQIGERVKRGDSRLAAGVEEREFDERRAETVLPLVAQLLGIDT
jgi:hypothetical protein